LLAQNNRYKSRIAIRSRIWILCPTTLLYLQYTTIQLVWSWGFYSNRGISSLECFYI
jgi:hypothetical protein